MVYIADKKWFGEFLALHRQQVNLSQVQVAQIAGHKNSQFISNIERGKASPPLSLLKLLIEIYGIEPKRLTQCLTQQFQFHLLSQLTNEKTS